MGRESRPQAEPTSDEPDALDLFENFSRARAILSAMVGATRPNEAVVVAVNERGFPVAQQLVPRPDDLPTAIVVGRHNRCTLAIPGDPRVSLRHLLLTIWPSRGGLRMRGYDLGGRAGVMLADAKRVPGFVAQGQLALTFGRTALYVIPGDAAGGWIDGSIEEAYRTLTGLSPRGDGQRLALSATTRPGVAQIGGYRPMNVDVPPESRGQLRLRTTKHERGEADATGVDVDADQLERGLLIGRYSDRCSLAGGGRNLSRVHALVAEESSTSLLVYDLASTNGVRPHARTEGPSNPVVRLTPDESCMLGHFELSWSPSEPPTIH